MDAMNSMDLTNIMLGILITALGIMIFFKPLKIFFKFLIRTIVCSGFGILALWGTNYLVGSLGISVGINFLTVLTIGFLGLPGFILLYAIKWLL